MPRRTTSGGSLRIMTVAFFTPQDVNRERTTWFQRLTMDLVGCWTAAPDGDGLRVTHAEIMFSDWHVFGITEADGVHYVDRRLSNPGYRHFFDLYLKPEREDKIQACARRIYEQQPSFNTAGQWWNFAPVLRWAPLRREGRQYFCSELLTTVLQEGNLLLWLDPVTTTPMQLYQEIPQLPEAGISYNRKIARDDLPPIDAFKNV